MSFQKQIVLSLGTAIAVSLLVSASACTFSKGPINDFVVGSEGAKDSDIDPAPEAPVAGNDDIIAPATPSVPNEAPTETPDNDTPPPAEPTPSPETPNDETATCHRIAYVSSANAFDDRPFVATDCVGDQPKEARNDVVFIGGTQIAHAAPTFATDGEALTTYMISWADTNLDTLSGFQSSFALDTFGEPILKDNLSGDRDGDNVLDVARFLSVQNPLDALGQLTITAPAPVCGNGVVDGFEVCDDGNQNDLDTCSNVCLPVGGFSSVPLEPGFAKSLVYTKKATASGLSVKKTIVEGETSVKGAVFTRENSVIFTARLNGATDDNLYAFDLENGTAPVKISGLSEEGVNESQASLSPDGKKIVFVRAFEITTCDLIVTHLLPVNIKNYACVNPVKISVGTFDGFKNISPCYSHDANHIFFISNAAHGANGSEHDTEVWRVKAGGSFDASPVNVTDNNSTERALTCSPTAGPAGILK